MIDAPTLADLRNIAPGRVSWRGKVNGFRGASADIVIVHGRETPYDEGGGVFVWDSTVTLDDDALQIRVNNYAGAGGFRRLCSERINVKWFGVKGDGVTDDTTNLQRVFDYAEGRSIEVVFPRGRYMVTEITVKGHQSYATNITGVQGNADPTDGTIIARIPGTPVSGPMVRLQSVTNSCIRNINFTGSDTTNLTLVKAHYTATRGGAHKIQLEHCSFGGVKGANAILFQAGDSDPANATRQASEISFYRCSFGGDSITAPTCGRGFFGASTAGGGNEKNFQFFSCEFGALVCAIDTQYCQGSTAVVAGSYFAWNDLDFRVGADHYSVNGSSSEGSRQWFAGGGTATSSSFSANGSYWHGSSVSGNIADYDGAISLVGCDIANDQGIPWIRVNNISSATTPTSYFGRGNSWMTGNDTFPVAELPIRVAATSAFAAGFVEHDIRIDSMGEFALNASRVVTLHFPTRFAGQKQIKALRINRGIINDVGVHTAETNVSAGATLVTVTGLSQPDALYRVVGVVPSWNTTVWVTGRTTSQFVINFGTAAPGGGGTVMWELVRGVTSLITA